MRARVHQLVATSLNTSGWSINRFLQKVAIIVSFILCYLLCFVFMTNFTLQLNSLEPLLPATFWISRGRKCPPILIPQHCLPLFPRIVRFSAFPLFRFSCSFIFIKFGNSLSFAFPSQMCTGKSPYEHEHALGDN